MAEQMDPPIGPEGEGGPEQQSPKSPEQQKAEKHMFLFRVCLAEALVTFLFLFIVMASSLNFQRLKLRSSGVEAAIVTGFSAVSLIYSFADVSGAHFNPAVTFATIITHKTSIRKGLGYIAAQLGASILAVLWIGFLFGFSEVEKLNVMPAETGVRLAQAFLMETTLTYILCYVIFATAFDDIPAKGEEERISKAISKAGGTGRAKGLTVYSVAGTSKAGFAPIAIGFTLGFLTMIGGGVSGGAFNPARVFGPALCTGHIFTKGNLWLYWVGDFAGAAGAGLTQHFFHTMRRFEDEELTLKALFGALMPREVNQLKQMVTQHAHPHQQEES